MILLTEHLSSWDYRDVPLNPVIPEHWAYYVPYVALCIFQGYVYGLCPYQTYIMVAKADNEQQITTIMVFDRLNPEESKTW